MSRQIFIGHEKSLVVEDVIKSGQINGMERSQYLLQQKNFIWLSHLGGHPLQLVGAVHKEQEVDLPVVGLVPAELFAMECCRCAKFTQAQSETGQTEEIHCGLLRKKIINPRRIK